MTSSWWLCSRNEYRVRMRLAKEIGLDVALRTLAAQPYGTVLLLLVAAGLATFAVFTLLDARYRRVG